MASSMDVSDEDHFRKQRDELKLKLNEADNQITQLMLDVRTLKESKNLLQGEVDSIKGLLKHWEKYSEMIKGDLDQQRKDNEALRNRIDKLEREKVSMVCSAYSTPITRNDTNF